MLDKIETWITILLVIVMIMLVAPLTKEFLRSIYTIFKNLINGLNSTDKEERKISAYGLILGILMSILLILIIIKGVSELM